MTQRKNNGLNDCYLDLSPMLRVVNTYAKEINMAN